ncbi:MAG: hypothetical protein KTR15_01085 [Phycisphaeraceae bacterium]|nr:hypothetical protein [Phycisphaeraceae bacterium]
MKRVSMGLISPDEEGRMPKSQRAILTALLLLTLGTIGCTASANHDNKKRSLTASADYTPQIGDVIFQSSEHTPLVDMIEGVSRSHYSHCGIVDQRDGQWVVYEAGRQVKATLLDAFIDRGRGDGFAAYRFKDEYQDDIPRIIEHTRAYLGSPYDFRYRLDEEHIYCSELIYKAFEQTTGETMGELTRLGDTDWQPYEQLILELENGPVPLDRVIITPIGLALADQLEVVYAVGFEVTKP